MIGPQLTVLLDGKPVYLYRILQGSYEDKRHFLCAHEEALSDIEIHGRIRGSTDLLPEEIDYDYMADPRDPDLFERALKLAGFTVLDELIPLGLWIHSAFPPVTEREALNRSLDREKPKP